MFAPKYSNQKETDEVARKDKISLLILTLGLFDVGFLMVFMHEIIRNIVIMIFLVYFIVISFIMFKYRNKYIKLLIQYFPFGFLTVFILSVFNEMLGQIGILYLLLITLLLASILIVLYEFKTSQALLFKELITYTMKKKKNEN